MATWQGVNINTGAIELPKYNAEGNYEEIYIASVSTALANGDTIYGPVIMAASSGTLEVPGNTGPFVVDVVAAPDKLDSAGSGLITFEVGFQNSSTYLPAAFITTGQTTAQAGGKATLNVPAAYGTCFATNTTVIAVITAGAGTAVAGNFRLGVRLTASP